MPTRIVEFRTDKSTVRRAREWKTVATMVHMYCRHHHGGDPVPCGECAALMDYAQRRLDRCLFGDAKPTCANCVVHCYRDAGRGRMRVIMRWAGPRMLRRHPVLGILHLLDGRRPAPRLPSKPGRAGGVAGPASHEAAEPEAAKLEAAKPEDGVGTPPHGAD